MSNLEMPRAGLLGRSLGHSLSPQVHRFFGDYDYRLYAREPQDVAAFVREGMRAEGLRFLNVTIPYKKTVAALCDALSPAARRLGNVNFVRIAADGRLVGDNTDFFGFGRLLDELGVASLGGRVAAVLGRGGAAETARAVLEGRGASRVELVGRGEEPSPDAALIVNATPVGMYPHGEEVRLDISRFPNCEVVADLVYNPSPTRLVAEARACGKRAADGLTMLVAQGYRAFQLAFGDEAPTGNLYLYGPPASGKSTWAARLASATGRDAVDLDAEIVRRTGRAIAAIFAADGEAAFRAYERAALAEVAARPGRVVALGGGALLDPVARGIAEASGRVVVLDCPEPELLRRAALSEARPLLAGDRAARLRTLLASRRAHYESFARHVALAQEPLR